MNPPPRQAGPLGAKTAGPTPAPRRRSLTGPPVPIAFASSLDILIDTFTLTVAGALWPSVLSASQTDPLPPGDSQAVTLTVDIPVSAADGDTDTATVAAVSMLDPGVSDSATATTTAVIYRIFLPILFKSCQP
jgi:hypothetical protein